MCIRLFTENDFPKGTMNDRSIYLSQLNCHLISGSSTWLAGLPPGSLAQRKCGKRDWSPGRETPQCPPCSLEMDLLNEASGHWMGICILEQHQQTCFLVFVPQWKKRPFKCILKGFYRVLKCFQRSDVFHSGSRCLTTNPEANVATEPTRLLCAKFFRWHQSLHCQAFNSMWDSLSLLFQYKNASRYSLAVVMAGCHCVRPAGPGTKILWTAITIQTPSLSPFNYFNRNENYSSNYDTQPGRLSFCLRINTFVRR